jgi:hypothetical protein
MLPKWAPNPRVVLLGLPADIAETPGQIVSKQGSVLKGLVQAALKPACC